MGVPKLSASILNADFANLWGCVKEAIDAGVDMIHFDIADGCFVPNLSFGPLVVKALRKMTSHSFDVHLMVMKPEQYISELAECRVEYVYFHYEATKSHYRVLDIIKSQHIKAGIALNPLTPLKVLADILPELDAVLIMLVEPGFGGQRMIPRMLDKVRKLSELRMRERLDFKIVVDGGIKTHNVGNVVKAGADIIVVGSGIFMQESIKNAVLELKKKIREVRKDFD